MGIKINFFKSLSWEVKSVIWIFIGIILFTILSLVIAFWLSSKKSYIPNIQNNQSTDIIKSFDKLNFLVVRSDSQSGLYDNNSFSNIAGYDEKGNIVSTNDIENTYNFTYFQKSKGSLDLFSYNWDKSLRISKAGEISARTLTSKNVEKYHNFGVEYTSENSTWNVAEENIGGVDSGYLLKFYVVNKITNEEFEFETTNYIPISALAIYKNSLYFYTSKSPFNDKSEKFLVKYNLLTRQMENEVDFSIILGPNEIDLNDKIKISIDDNYIYFSGSPVTNEISGLDQVYLYKFALNFSGLISKYSFENSDIKHILIVESINDKFYLLYNNGEVQVLSNNLEFANSYKLDSTDGITVGLNRTLNSSFIYNGIGYVVTNDNTDEINNFGIKLSEFEIDSGKIIQNYVFKNPANRKDADKQDTYLVVPL